MTPTAPTLIASIQSARATMTELHHRWNATGLDFTAAEDARYTEAERAEEECQAQLDAVIFASMGVPADVLRSALI